uniref:Uncharacterized protein MANES_17G105300 n=1 Tax=Rhizophora mucronata TaxID=61149 RepID=A0A2P2K3Q6_RHIMU
MVLSPSSKSKKSSAQADYLIHIQEIKPWPPSQSLRSLRSVLIQWENGGRSGSTKAVVPSLGSVVGEGKIEFNESFRLRVTLLREMSVRGKDVDTFQKNCLELNLSEPRRDKMQLLATAVVDFADYGVIKETTIITVPMHSKRSFRNTSEPILYIKIQPVDKGHSSSSSRDRPAKGVSLDKNYGESVSSLMNEEYTEEAESTSFTDDDVSSHSSLTSGGLPPRNGENGPNRLMDSRGVSKDNTKPGLEKHTEENLNEVSSCSSSIDLSSDIGSSVNGQASCLDSPAPDSCSMLMRKDDAAQGVHFSSLPCNIEDKGEEATDNMRSNNHQDLEQDVHEMINGCTSTVRVETQQSSKENATVLFPAKVASLPDNLLMAEKLGSTTSSDFEIDRADDGKTQRSDKYSLEDNTFHSNLSCSSSEDTTGKNNEERCLSENGVIDTFAQTGNENSILSGTISPSGESGMHGTIFKVDRLKHVKSVRSPSDSVRSTGVVSRNQRIEVKEVAVLEDAEKSLGNISTTERINITFYPKSTKTTNLDAKIQQLELKIMMLEGELRESAGMEAALYSVIAEHGSSTSKVHAPARRLSRLYLHACEKQSHSRKGSVARSTVSGLVLVAKACGNDVPRLTFWLSNAVVLRAIICQAISHSELSLSVEPQMERNGREKSIRSTSLKWSNRSPDTKDKNAIYGDVGDWEKPCTFISVLERVEAWIFCRTVESIWWQTLTPHMQSAATNAIDDFVGSGSKKSLGRVSSSCDEDQVNFSLELWKKAFKDACERLCPVRAGGHECGCLPVPARLIMEQCVARLDVAMFNAILRESADDIPTDPVSDPISDSKVLPIPSGRSSFGAGAQLKNAIGNWSRWLTDLFGMDDDLLEEENDENNEREDASFKSFHLLNSLSDLMMLPKDMLLSKSIRKEVCPKFGAQLIKKVLDNFISDEFCPDPIPNVVLESLDSADATDAGEAPIITTPCIAAPPSYLPPSAASIAGTIGYFGSHSQLRRSGSSILRKSHTSDDELDELNSPLASILLENSQTSPALTKPNWKSKDKGNQSSVRYELLRDVWMKSQ